jgi:Ca2+-binding EF-hand superfamily protein
MAEHAGLRDHQGAETVDSSRSMDQWRAVAKAFFAADVNGDHVLDFDEFQSMHRKIRAHSPKESLSDEDCRVLFNIIDADHSGEITVHEYFLWVCSTVHDTGKQSGGAGAFEAIFR